MPLNTADRTGCFCKLFITPGFCRHLTLMTRVWDDEVTVFSSPSRGSLDGSVSGRRRRGGRLGLEQPRVRSGAIRPPAAGPARLCCSALPPPKPNPQLRSLWLAHMPVKVEGKGKKNVLEEKCEGSLCRKAGWSRREQSRCLCQGATSKRIGLL